MLNSINHLLPNSNTFWNLVSEETKFSSYLPNKWTLAWYLLQSYCQNKNKSNSPIETNELIAPNKSKSNATEKSVDSLILNKKESVNKPPTASNKTELSSTSVTPNYSIAGNYSINPHQNPSFSVKIQVNKPRHRVNKAKTKSTKTQIIKPIKRTSQRFKHQFNSGFNSKFLNFSKVLVGLGVLWLIILTGLVIKLMAKLKKRK